MVQKWYFVEEAAAGGGRLGISGAVEPPVGAVYGRVRRRVYGVQEDRLRGGGDQL